MTGVGGGGHGGGHKAVLAISEDNESAVIKYRSEQDMASICEYILVLERADGNSKGFNV